MYVGGIWPDTQPTYNCTVRISTTTMHPYYYILYWQFVLAVLPGTTSTIRGTFVGFGLSECWACEAGALKAKRLGRVVDS